MDRTQGCRSLVVSDYWLRVADHRIIILIRMFLYNKNKFLITVLTQIPGYRQTSLNSVHILQACSNPGQVLGFL